jgi:hypothetical protein
MSSDPRASSLPSNVEEVALQSTIVRRGCVERSESKDWDQKRRPPPNLDGDFCDFQNLANYFETRR